jgi:tetratricopeptide (TPR) repeat protein
MEEREDGLMTEQEIADLMLQVSSSPRKKKGGVARAGAGVVDEAEEGRGAHAGTGMLQIRTARQRVAEGMQEWSDRGDAAMQAGDYADAASHYSQGLCLDPTHRKLKNRYKRARSLAQKVAMAKADADAAAAAAVSDNDDDVWLLMQLNAHTEDLVRKVYRSIDTGDSGAISKAAIAESYFMRTMVDLGLGRIVALYYSSSTSYRIHSHIRYLVFLKRQCDRTLGGPRLAVLRMATQPVCAAVQ